MIDPMTAFAILKSGISAGKQLTSMTKDIAAFFDSVDGVKAKHKKKKSSMFASANEEAMDTFMRQQQAMDCEEELRELITSSRGISQWRNLQNLRREIRVERKEQARLDAIALEEKQQAVLLIVFVVILFGAFAATACAYLWWLGIIDF
jgi:hypothetical protein